MKNNTKTSPKIVLDEKFESVIRSVLRPFASQKPKPMETILERAQRRCQNRMGIVHPAAIREYLLRWGIEMQLFAPEEIAKAKAIIYELKNSY